jgi:hypothetical protein
MLLYNSPRTLSKNCIEFQHCLKRRFNKDINKTDIVFVRHLSYILNFPYCISNSESSACKDKRLIKIKTIKRFAGSDKLPKLVESASNIVKSSSAASASGHVDGQSTVEPMSSTQYLRETRRQKNIDNQESNTNTNECSENSVNDNKPIVTNIPGGLKINSIEKKVEELNVKPTTKNDSINIFEKYVENGVLTYNNKDQLKLTPEAQEIYISQLKPKLHLLEDNNKISDQVQISVSDNDPNVFVEEKNPRIAGVLKIKEETEILSVQGHVVTGIHNSDDTIKIDTMYTSEKGTKFGIAGCKTTELITPTKEFSGDTGGQYASSVIPPLLVNFEDIEVNHAATEYSNKPDIREKLDDIAEISNRYKTQVYTGIGVTLDDLSRIQELKDHQENNFSKQENLMPVEDQTNNMVNNEKSYNNDVD